MKTKSYLIAAVALLSWQTTQAQTPNLQWATHVGSRHGAANAEGVFGNSIAVDASGNVYTVGLFAGKDDFDPGPGTFYLNPALGNGFIQKLDASGNFVWAKNIANVVNSIALDAAANIYITGEFGIQKLDSSGNLLWAIDFSSTFVFFQPAPIAVDGAGNVFITGFFAGTLDFDPGVGKFILKANGYHAAFLLKLDTLGNFVWASALNSKRGFSEGHSVAVDASGNVYSTGLFAGTEDFDPGTGTFNLTGVDDDIYIQKLDTAGNFIWAKSMGSTSFDEGRAIAVDAAQNVYTTGIFSGTVDFDPGAGTFFLSTVDNSTLASDIFIQKLDAAGNFVWAKSMGAKPDPNEPFTYSNSIAVDPSGNVYTTGAFGGTVDFDPGSGTFNLVTNPTSLGDVFIQRLDASGNFVWARSVGSTAQDNGADIAVDASGNVYFTGSFGGTVDFDPTAGTFNLTSTYFDAFVTKWGQ